MYNVSMVKKSVSPVKILESRSKFAKRAGVSAAAITKACTTVLKPATVGKYVDVAHPAAINYLKRDDDVTTKMSVTGIDNMYDEAVAHCHKIKKISVSAIRQEFKIGYVRAKKIVDMMEIAGVVIDPDAAPPPPPKPKKKTAPPPPPASVDADKTYCEIPEDIQTFVDMTLRELITRYGTDTRFVDWLRAAKLIEEINDKRLKNASAKNELISKSLVQKNVIDVFNAAHLKLMKDGAKSIAAGAVSKHVSGAELIDIERYVSDILGSFVSPVKSKIKRSLENA